MGDLIAVFTAVATAFGTPGLTYLVMNKMQKAQISKIKELHDLQINHMQESCKNCRKGLDEKIEGLDEDLGEVSHRQKSLREETLPEKYVTRRDCEKFQKETKDALEVVHGRISGYHPKAGGA